MEFKEFNERLQRHIAFLVGSKEYLFKVQLDNEKMWSTYLDSFPEGTNQVFRERREYDCSCCRHYIRDLGRVVAIKDQKVETIWDFDTGSTTYQPVVDALSKLVKSSPIVDVYLPTSKSVGTSHSRECLEDGTIHTWHHFYSVFPKTLKQFREDEVGTIQGRMRDIRNVFKRSLDEITSDSVDTILEIISQNSLYRGEEWGPALTKFKSLQREYLKLENEESKSLFCWEKSIQVGGAVGKIRNHSIGTLLTDLSDGMDLDIAVRRYEAIVAPTNYRRSRPIFSKRMIEQAHEKVKELGFEDSLGRRFARVEDISAADVLFADRDARRAMSGNAFEELAATVPDKPKNLSKVEEMPISGFLQYVLPTVREMQILLESKHGGNLASLIAPKNPESKSMFKWKTNGFSWAYSGNIADSMKERVKAAGGNVEGVLRFSIQWNENDDNHSDLDAHCAEPSGFHISFRQKINRNTLGNLDVDIIQPKGVAVENITWPDRRRMEHGKYRFAVHCYGERRAESGFTAEIEFDGNVYSFEHPMPLRQGHTVEVAEVIFNGEEFALREVLKSRQSSREMWGLQSNKFHPVSVMALSPNVWEGTGGVGNRHYFFFIDGCVNPDLPNGFYGEFLDQRLMEHKRVFEALGAKMRVEDNEHQLSGLGFSSTRRNDVIVKVKGAFSRMLKILF